MRMARELSKLMRVSPARASASSERVSVGSRVLVPPSALLLASAAHIEAAQMERASSK